MQLIDRLPLFYREAKEVIDLQAALENEILEVGSKIIELTNDLFIITSKNISEWENILGIKPDITKTLEIRTNNIKSKLAGIGTFTKGMLIQTLSSYESGNAEIIEQAYKHTFIIKFNNVYKVPSKESIKEMYSVVEILKPAHLDFSHTFTYNWWDRKELKAKTWDDIGTWQVFRNYEEVM